MASYSQINHGMWQDEAITALSSDAFRLWLWSWTNGPGASLTGMTEASVRKMIAAVWPGQRRTEEDLAGLLDELAAKPLAVYDWDGELLWCVRRMRYSLINPNTVRGAIKWLQRMPPSPLHEQVIAMYPSVAVEVG